MSPGATALAVVLLAGGRSLPKRSVRYLVLWRHSGVASLLSKYGVRVEVKRYWNNVGGYRYWRYKIIVRDPRVTGELARATRATLYRSMMRRVGLVRETLMRLGRVIANIHEYIPARVLQRALGIKPFDYWRYAPFQKRRFIRHIKPNWRAWLYFKRRKAMERWWSDDDDDDDWHW